MDMKHSRRLEDCRQLPVQGDIVHQFDDQSSSIWAETIWFLPEKVMKFALNTIQDTSLITQANLHLWRKKHHLTVNRNNLEQTRSKKSSTKIFTTKSDVSATQAFVSYIQMWFVCSWQRPAWPKHPILLWRFLLKIFCYMFAQDYSN